MWTDISTRFGKGVCHPRYRTNEQLLKELAKYDLNCLSLTGRIEQHERSRRMCEVFCSECKQTKLVLVDNIRSGKARNCKCQRARKYPVGSPADTLGRRYDAMMQRCYHDTHVSSHNYKGRGIRVLFKSREDFIRWALKRWPGQSFEGLDFDRINNDGHYSRSNLRLVTRAENLRNRRRRPKLGN